MRKSLLGLAFALGIGPALAADPPAAADTDCAKYACRPMRAVDIRTRDNGSIHVRFGPTPYVKGGTIMILPGETLVFRFPASDAPLGEPVFVREDTFALGQPTGADVKFPIPENDPNRGVLRQAFGDIQANGTADKRLASEPPGTFFVAYRQVPDGTGMYLVMAQNFPQPLKLDATIAIPGSASFRPSYSSTCAIHPSVFSNETWPDGLGPIILQHFRLVPEDKMTCE